MEIENLFDEWSTAYRAKGGKITVSAEELFADFFRWLKSKAAEQSVQRTVDQPCEKHNMEFCSECFPVVVVDFNRR